MSDRSREITDFVLGGVPLVGLLCSLTLAGPDDPQVVRGTASILHNGPRTTITVSDNAVLNYERFNILKPETVRFIQPRVDSRVLNRITGGAPTRIDGALLANGNVYIVNPAGVVFGKDSVVNVGSLIAAAGSLSDRDFLRGVNRFTGLVGEVRNEGDIRAGSVALVGNRVVNLGSIIAPEGMIAMVAGDEVYLGREGSRMYARIESTQDAAAAPGGVRNEGEIHASGGRAVLAAGDMFSLALGTGSTITAKDVQVRGGEASLVTVSGTIDASAIDRGLRGGRVEVTGDRVGLFDASIDASGPAGGGEILVGGDYQGTGDTPTASRTFVGDGSVLRANATERGDGGKVIVWADERTGFYGEISARGGASGGDGGFAEVSGKRSLAARGRVDLGAPKGDVGTLLYDPDAIEIQGGTGDGTDDTDSSNSNLETDGGTAGEVLFGDTGTGAEPFIVRESEIEGTDADIVLEAGSEITVSGSFGGGQLLVSNNRDLTLRTRNKSGDGDSAGGIDLTGAVEGNSLVIQTQGTGSITIEAGWDSGDVGNEAGDLLADVALPSLVTENGSISIRAGSTTASSVDLNGAMTGGGGVALQGPTVNLNANISTTGGPVVFDHTAAQDIIVGADVTIDTDAAGGASDAGDISFQATNTNVDGTTASTEMLTLDASADGGGTGGTIVLRRVGQSTPFAAFVASAGPNTINLNGDVSADTVTFNDAVSLTADGIDVTGATAVSFNSTVDADNAGANNRTLTVTSGTGTATFGGAIGGAQALADLDVTAATISLGGNVTADDQGGNTATFTGPVTLAGNVAIDTDGTTDNSVSFTSTINGDGVATRDLTVTGGSLTIAGEVGGSVPLGTMISNAPTTIQGDVAAGTVGFNDTLTVAGTGERAILATDADTAAFASTVTLAPTVTGLRIRAEEIDFGGNVSPAAGASQTLRLEAFTNPIVLNGTAASGQLDLLQAELDRIQPGFSGVTIGRADSVSGVRVAATGVQFGAFDATVAVGANQFVTVGGDVDTMGNDLTVTVGNAGRLRLGADVSTRGGNLDITGASTVDLVADSVLDTDQSGGASDAGDIAFSPAGTVDGAFDLSLLADADGGGAAGSVVAARVGTQTALGGFTVKGGAVTLPGIGAGSSAGVSGTTDVEADGGLTFSGTLYLTNDAAYKASSVAISGPAGQASRFGATDDTITFGAFGGGDGAVSLAEDVDVVIDAGGGGVVVIEGPLDATAGGQGESATITAGTTRLSSDVGSSASLDSLQVNGSLQVAEGGTVAITTDGDIGISGSVFGTDAGAAESVTFTAGGETTIGDGIFGRSGRDATASGLTTVTANGPLSLSGGVRITGGGLTSGGLLTVATPSILSAGSGTLTIESAQLLGATTLEAAEIDFGGGPIVGAVALQLQPDLDSAAINVGSAGNAGDPAGLDLSQAELAVLADGFSSITIGRDAGGHAILIGDASFSDPLVVQATGGGGTISVAGAIVGTDNAGVTLRGSGVGTTFQSGARVSTSGGAIVLDDDVFVASGVSASMTSGGGDATLQRSITLGGGSALSVATGGGDATLAADGSGIDGGGALTLDTGAGSIAVVGPVGGTTPLASVEAAGGAVALPSVIATTGSQTYSGAVTSGGVYTSSAGGLQFDGSLLLSQDLALDAGGDVLINGSVDDTGANRSGLLIEANGLGAVSLGAAVGGTSPIGALRIENATTVTAAGLVSARSIVTRNVLGGANFNEMVTDAAGGSAAIDLQAASFQLPGPFTTAANTGILIDITGGAAAVVGSAANTWDGLGGGFTQTGATGVVRLGTDVAKAGGSAIPGDFTLAGVLELASGSRVVSARNVALNSGFRATAGQHGVPDLTLRGALVTIDGGSTGDATDTLVRTLSVEGVSSIQGAIGATSGVSFSSDVGLTGATRVRVSDAGNIVFGGDITSTNTSTLTVQTDPSQTINTNTPADGNVVLGTFADDVLFPVIEFGGDIGTGQNPLGSLSLNPVAHTTIPGLPTIVSRSAGGLSIFVRDGFTMGGGEKLTTLGPLTVRSTLGDITLGDLAVAGDLSLTTPGTVNLLSRAVSPIIGYAKREGTRAVEDDDGGDLVVLGLATVTGDIRVVASGGSRRYTVSSGNIANLGTFAGAANVSLRQFGETANSLDRGDFWTTGATRGEGEVLGDPPPDALALDLRASGPVVQDVASALAGAIPRDPESGQVARETRLSAAQLEKLLLININAVQRDGIRLAPGGPRVYNDIEEVNKLHQVSVNRMSSDAVDRVLETFDRVFYRGEGAERVFSADTIRREIQEAVVPYFDEPDATPDAGRIWEYLVSGSPEQVRSARTLYEVQVLLGEIGRLGLTDAEAELPRRRVIDYLYSSEAFGDPAELSALVAAAGPVDVSTTPSPEGPGAATPEAASQP